MTAQGLAAKLADPTTFTAGELAIISGSFGVRIADLLNVMADGGDMSKISLTLAEAKEATGISVRALQYAIERGDLTARYNGARPVVRVEDLDEYVRALPTEAPAKRTA